MTAWEDSIVRGLMRHLRPTVPAHITIIHVLDHTILILAQDHMQQETAQAHGAYARDLLLAVRLEIVQIVAVNPDAHGALIWW